MRNDRSYVCYVKKAHSDNLEDIGYKHHDSMIEYFFKKISRMNEMMKMIILCSSFHKALTRDFLLEPLARRFAETTTLNHY